MSKTVFILNGCNLNALGKRQPSIYGNKTLAEIKEECNKAASLLEFNIDFRQSNHEGDLIDWIHEAGEKAFGLILNAAAWTHTSIGIHDALQSNIPPLLLIEVHCSNIHSRESFRRKSIIAPLSTGLIYGLGSLGYRLALQALKEMQPMFQQQLEK